MNGLMIDVTSRKIIKPASLTHHPKTFKLSLLDQHYPPYYGAIVFFYHSNTSHGHTISQSDCLQKSLSKTLVHYYPLAGRLKDTFLIECNDEGAYFVEAKIGCKLIDFLERPDGYAMDHFLPIKDPKMVPLAMDCVLLVQLSIFSCGGVSIAVCPSHKIFDAASLCTFVQSWCALSRGFGKVVQPNFVGSSLLPPRDSPFFPLTERPTDKCAIRRFVFDAFKISSLKANIGGTIGKRGVSSIGLVMALILKCAIAASRSISGSSASSLLLHMVDLRKRMDPPLTENSLGNLAWGLPVLIEENETEIIDLVAKTRRVLTEFYSKKASRFNGDVGFVLKSYQERQVLSGKTRSKISYVGSSLCKYPLYEMDFGWGKPIWVTCKSNYRNSIFLLDNKRGDAIEAWITLDEQEMALFESDEELLAFASLNPSASFTCSRM